MVRGARGGRKASAARGGGKDSVTGKDYRENLKSQPASLANERISKEYLGGSQTACSNQHGSGLTEPVQSDKELDEVNGNGNARHTTSPTFAECINACTPATPPEMKQQFVVGKEETLLASDNKFLAAASRTVMWSPTKTADCNKKRGRSTSSAQIENESKRIVVHASEVMLWVDKCSKPLVEYQQPLITAYLAMSCYERDVLELPKFYGSFQPLAAIPSTINGLSGELVGLVKMAFTLWPEVPNSAIAHVLGLPWFVLDLVEDQYLLSMGRGWMAEKAVKKKEILSRTQRNQMLSLLAVENMTPKAVAAQMDINMATFRYEWAVELNLPMMFLPHFLSPHEQPSAHGGSDLAEGANVYDMGFLYGHGKYIFDECGVKKGGAELNAYRFNATYLVQKTSVGSSSSQE